MIQFIPDRYASEPELFELLGEAVIDDFRQFCRARSINWADIAHQALALGAHDPESFTRAVGHLIGETSCQQ